MDALTHWLALDGRGNWGKGDTRQAARKQLLKAARRMVKTAALYRCPADYWIDEMGNGHGSATVELVKGSDQRT